MASSTYNVFKGKIMGGDYDLSTGGNTLKCALTTNLYIPALSDATFADVDNEVVGTGYTADGKTMTGQQVTVENGTNEGKFDAEDTQWTGASFTARYAVLYATDATPADSLICWIDFGSNVTVTAGTLTIAWDSDGIINIG